MSKFSKKEKITESCTNERCKCGNQYHETAGYLYCHKCDINNDTLASVFENAGYLCDCDYCKERLRKR